MTKLGKDWIDNDGRFLFGKHKGEYVDDVAEEDPGYLRWIVEEVEDVSEEDWDVLNTRVDRKGGW